MNPKRILLLPLLACATAAQLSAITPTPTQAPKATVTPVVTPTPSVSPTPKPTPSDVQNTARNARDTQPGAVLPTDQSNKPEDLKATQEIRKAVMADKALSTNAKNAKIITTESMVVLRGPVDSTADKDSLNKYAKEFAGSRTVRDELEVRAAAKK